MPRFIRRKSNRPADDKPVYMISVAARLAGVHPQTLRLYERKRLLTPGRTPKSTRLYSQRDIERLRYIQHLVQKEGVNLAGARLIMEMESEVDRWKQELEAVKEQMESMRSRLEAELLRIRFRPGTELVVLRRGEIMKR